VRNTLLKEQQTVERAGAVGLIRQWMAGRGGNQA
jgi:hypothetical protein